MPRTPGREAVIITGIHLLKESGCAVVKVEMNGRWVEVIRENAALNFSHIVEPGGMMKAAGPEPEYNGGDTPPI